MLDIGPIYVHYAQIALGAGSCTCCFNKLFANFNVDHVCVCVCVYCVCVCVCVSVFWLVVSPCCIFDSDLTAAIVTKTTIAAVVQCAYINSYNDQCTYKSCSNQSV